MSNPLLRPNDPRFQRPDVRDTAGKNRFAESGNASDSAAQSAEIFSAATRDESRPFVPHYDVQQRSRPEMLFVLGAMGWMAALFGAISFTGALYVGWIGPLLGVIPSGAAWLLAHEELKQISAGVIVSEAGGKVRHAYWLGLTALLACAALVATMIYRRMNFLPDL